MYQNRENMQLILTINTKLWWGYFAMLQAQDTSSEFCTFSWSASEIVTCDKVLSFILRLVWLGTPEAILQKPS